MWYVCRRYVNRLTQLFQSFSILGLRSILVLYFISSLHWGDSHAYMVYGSYISLLCVAPVVGGYLTDHYLGIRDAIIYGGIVSVFGQLTLALFPATQLFLGLSAIVVGTALMLPTLCSSIGIIFQDDHLRHDRAYNYFYLSVNVGGILAAVSIGFIAKQYGWQVGFALTTVATITSLIIFWTSKIKFAIPERKLKHTHVGVGLIASIFIINMLFHHLASIKWLLIGVGLFAIANITRIAKGSDYPARKKLILLSIIFILSIFYFVMYEQTGTSITLFTERVISRHAFHHTIPTPVLTALNPLYVILLTPLLGLFWPLLAKRNREPSILTKMGMGIFITSVGFLVLAIAGHYVHPNLMWLVGASLFTTLGELLVAPVSLSAISTLAPKQHKTTLLGIWFIVGSIASYLSAMLAKLTSLHAGDGALTMHYSEIFRFIGDDGLIVAVAILVFAPMLMKRYNGNN